MPQVGPPGDSLLHQLVAPGTTTPSPAGLQGDGQHHGGADVFPLLLQEPVFSGVATANDHFPHEINEPFLPRLPIRVIGRVHPGPRMLLLRPQVGGRHRDRAQAGGGTQLALHHPPRGGLRRRSPRTGSASWSAWAAWTSTTSSSTASASPTRTSAKTAKAGASISWCPASNMLMFNVTCKIRKILRRGDQRLPWARTPPHTGSVNLLSEMKYARKVYREMYGEELPAKTLFRHGDRQPRQGLPHAGAGSGILEPGKSADLLVLRAEPRRPLREPWPGRNLADIRLRDAGGTVPCLVEDSLAEPSEGMPVQGLRRQVRGRPGGLCPRRPRGAVPARSARPIGFDKKLDYLPFERVMPENSALTSVECAAVHYTGYRSAAPTARVGAEKRCRR
ncbi:MAG: hypothetical protein MZV70_22135 [Desulfobacterales bacterium]|nr:hypothetical protein [Desulfobacterales bacterium]